MILIDQQSYVYYLNKQNILEMIILFMGLITKNDYINIKIIRLISFRD